MDNPARIPLSPEQLAAVKAGQGFAHLVDPENQVVYVLTEQIKPSLDDNYVRAKIDEAQKSVDRNNVAEWDVEELKQDVRRRLSDSL